MANPVGTAQLLEGFYPVEENAWRWVESNFRVVLKPVKPAGAGGRLLVDLYFPEFEIKKIGALTLTATIDGKTVGRQVFAAPGAAQFIANLTNEQLDTNVLPVEFCFDKSMSETEEDQRELAAVVSRISLVSNR
jgi:hypothetical protein